MSLFSQAFVFLCHVEQIVARQGFGRRAQSVSSSDSCIALISIFHFVYVARFGQQEAREAWQLMKQFLKLLPSDVHHDILEAMAD